MTAFKVELPASRPTQTRFGRCASACFSAFTIRFRSTILQRMASDKSSNLALLIDGDNVSPKIIEGLLAEVANYGTASVRRIYGDWTQPNMNSWKKCLLDHSIQPMQQFMYTTHKNSTDGAMIIDAMDLLYTNRFTSFCLVSSDSDFTRLTARIREQGVTVYGFGERKTNNAFAAACSKFVYFDVLNVSFTATPTEVHQPLSTQAISGTRNPIPTTRPVLHTTSTKRPIDQAALDGLTKAITSSAAGFDGEWANLADVGHYLNKLSPDLNARNYGFDRLKEFVEASGIVTLRKQDMGANPPVVFARLKGTTQEDLALRHSAS